MVCFGQTSLIRVIPDRLLGTDWHLLYNTYLHFPTKTRSANSQLHWTFILVVPCSKSGDQTCQVSGRCHAKVDNNVRSTASPFSLLTLCCFLLGGHAGQAGGPVLKRTCWQHDWSISEILFRLRIMKQTSKETTTRIQSSFVVFVQSLPQCSRLSWCRRTMCGLARHIDRLVEVIRVEGVLQTGYSI